MDRKQLCIGLVLAIVGTGYAQGTVTGHWRAEGPVEAGSSLYTYVLEASTTHGKITAFTLDITGNAHQVWPVVVGTQETPYKGDMTPENGGKEAWEVYDSHVLGRWSEFLSYPAGDVKAVEGPLVPSNPNPAELDLQTTVTVNGTELAVSPDVGVGPVEVTLGLGGSLQGSKVDLYKLVVLEGAEVDFTFSAATRDDQSFSLDAAFVGGQEHKVDDRGQLIVVPEPMTMSLLGLGGLAVLRRRRKA